MKAPGSLRQQRRSMNAVSSHHTHSLVPLSLRKCCRLRYVAIVLGSLYILYLLKSFQMLSTGSSSSILLHQQPHGSSDNDPFPRLDFLVAGFPKCGTTSLLYSLTAHPEIAIDRAEHCAIAFDKGYSESVVAQMFRNDMQALEKTDAIVNQANSANQANSKVTGIKCPDALYKDRAIRRLVDWQKPNAASRKTITSTRLIIGLRHPVWQMQSYYNYRVTEMYDKKVWWKIFRSLPDILEGRTKPWKGMSPYSVRYELFLQQLDKVNLTATELADFQQYPELSVQPNPFRVFVYALEQLEDADVDRNAIFRRDLADFLHLEQSLPEVGHENRNHFTGAAAHPETIDICESSFQRVRQQMVNDATVSAQWIWERFINAADVTVSNRDHFLAALEGWKKDPCLGA
jgi:hypothetical protein